MNVSSNLASRLSMGTGDDGWTKQRGEGHDDDRADYRNVAPGVGEALARRLGGLASGFSVRVGIKARLGSGSSVRGSANLPPPDRHVQQTEELGYNLYPPNTSEQHPELAAADTDKRRKKTRGTAVGARRGMQESGNRPPSSPVMVKMASGKLVGGMRSDQIWKSPRRKPKYDQSPDRGAADPTQAGGGSVVSMDADRGLTVSLQNKERRRRSPVGRRQDDRSRPSQSYGARGGDGRRRPRGGSAGRGGGGPGLYNEHDDRLYIEQNTRVGADLHSDWDDSEEDVGLELRGHRRYDSDSMDVDSNNGGDVYNASLMYTRTTTHHHHHHHHIPSPPPQPQRYALYRHPRASPEPMYVDRASPPPNERLVYRDRSPRYAVPQYTPPPPPSPPSFHPRYKYVVPSPSPPPPPPRYGSRQLVEVVRPKTKSSRIVSRSTKPIKSTKSVKRVKQMKPAKKVKKVVKPVKSTKGKSSGKGRKVHVNRSSSPDTISSGSSSDSSSSSSSESGPVYQPPMERVLPEPHKQVLDPKVLESIAALQGKDPGYKSGPGPGVKNLIFIPNKTNKSLNQRFTVVDAAR